VRGKLPIIPTEKSCFPVSGLIQNRMAASPESGLSIAVVTVAIDAELQLLWIYLLVLRR
jgi:hypothetical protein